MNLKIEKEKIILHTIESIGNEKQIRKISKNVSLQSHLFLIVYSMDGEKAWMHEVNF